MNCGDIFLADKLGMSSHKKKPFDKLIRGKYTEEVLRSAVIAVLRGELDVAAGSKQFGMSERTLRRHVK